MSAYVWIDDAKAAALRKAITLFGDCQEARSIQEILGEVDKIEKSKINSLFVIG